MDVAVVASFCAAGLSFVSVLVGLRSQHRNGTEQWRRDVERPLVAEILELSSVCTDKWMEAANARQRWIDTDPEASSAGTKLEAWERTRASYEAAYAEYRSLRKKLGELDLIASDEVRDAASLFGQLHQRYAIALNTAGGQTSPVAAHDRITTNMHARRRALMSAVRKDIGVDRGLAHWAETLKTSARLRRSDRRLQRRRQQLKLPPGDPLLPLHSGGSGRRPADLSVLREPEEAVDGSN